MRALVECALILAATVTIAVSVARCTPQQTKTGADVAVRIADGVCKEVDDQDAPAWVHLVCQAVGAAGGVVDVLLPRQEWMAIRARTADSGPGK